MNPNGNPQTLVPAPPGNTRALSHGVYSRNGRALAPRADEIADALMSIPHAQPLDLLAAQEIGPLLATQRAHDRARDDLLAELHVEETSFAAALHRLCTRPRSQCPCRFPGRHLLL